MYDRRRQWMVDRQIAARGVRSSLVLDAMNTVPREEFIAESLREFAYDDRPLPINENQTISQPYIVAYMTEALQSTGSEKVLEVGTGSGYAAAILGEIAKSVISLERHESLANSAREVLENLGYDNVQVIHTDGTLGYPAQAPYDAIIVAAGAPAVPQPLKNQLAIGGRLVIPVRVSDSFQTLVRVTREGEQQYREERLTDVRFVPLIGEQGWDSEEETRYPSHRKTTKPTVSHLIAEVAEPIGDIDTAGLERTLERIGDARIVLIGEATHGTSEFYRYRARISRKLIEEKGFNFVAIEADWPDASRIDHYVRHREAPPAEWTAFSRFPTWMWRNEEVREFVDWLHQYNAGIEDPEQRVGFYGLDLYSLFTSIEAVLGYLDEVDKDAAQVARQRYGCLEPWQNDPATYGRATASGRHRECEADVVAMLKELLNKRMDYLERDGARFLDAVQNARLITNAERYYRTLYGAYNESWNLRDRHMFETLQALMTHGGENMKAVVWEHNSHIGDATATDMVERGQLNVGQLCREAYGAEAYLIGFGTHSGTVAAASDWDAPMEVKTVLPSQAGSWERLCHDTGIPAFSLDLRHSPSDLLSRRLRESQLERAIGVIYRPETERASHYFKARLADQFDEYIWFDDTHAVTPLTTSALAGVPETYPFGI
jgi:protein-L-isoaspartate(D-aspartate) O-methyltransferase